MQKPDHVQELDKIFDMEEALAAPIFEHRTYEPVALNTDTYKAAVKILDQLDKDFWTKAGVLDLGNPEL